MENKELASGTTLQSGKYTIERVLGAGGFGITYYARHNTLGNHVAIKEFFISGYCVRNTVRKSVLLQGLDSVVYDKYLQKFIEEAQILAQLDQPNIVKVIDIFRENNTAYIVMPFVEGQTLQQSVEQKGRLDYETAVNYIAQLSEAVDYIHQRNILHRDIKPDNVIITPENKAILIDFGSAREFIQDKTQNLTSIYTQGYAPLEQYSANSRKGSYSDIYSLGATFYFALTGQKPMDAATRMIETMPEPKALVPSIPEEANRTIMKAMSLKPEDRQQRINEFMGDLLNKRRVIVLTNYNTPSSTKKKTSRKMPIIFFAVLILVLLIGVGGYYGVKQWQYSQQELTAYTNVISANNITDCDNYLNIYPDGKHRTEVQHLRDQLQQKQKEEERARIAQEQAILTTDQGVVINGIRWATRNVDKHGTFARSPESTGEFYPFPLNLPKVPSPVGWRLPTKYELQSLLNAGSVWTTRNGVNGRLFGTAPNQIFLPASGMIYWNHIDRDPPGERGLYWSSTPEMYEYSYTPPTVYSAFQLEFDRNEVDVHGIIADCEICIRCVKE